MLTFLFLLILKIKNHLLFVIHTKHIYFRSAVLNYNKLYLNLILKLLFMILEFVRTLNIALNLMVIYTEGL